MIQILTKEDMCRKNIIERESLEIYQLYLTYKVMTANSLEKQVEKYANFKNEQLTFNMMNLLEYAFEFTIMYMNFHNIIEHHIVYNDTNRLKLMKYIKIKHRTKYGNCICVICCI